MSILPIVDLSVPPAPAPIPGPRWIGFDMDDCIGNVMPVARFVKIFGAKPVANALAPYEMCGETWVLRPGFTDVVTAVADAYKSNAIEGAFLYSNNGSSGNVEFARSLLNAIAENVRSVRPFRIGFHRGNASRSSFDKNFTDICNMLHCADRAAPTRPEDVAFFDDQFHPLATEIRHYYRVPKYSTWTPIDKIKDALQPLRAENVEMFHRTTTISYIDQDEQKNPVVHECPPVDSTVIDIFLQGIQKFLDPPAPEFQILED
jgi:hypothetical protein